MSKRDYYDVLGVDRSATRDEVKRAYRNLARQYHPDVNPDNPEAEDRFKELSEAYSVLSDGQKRARYDRYGHDAPSSNGFGDFGFGFEDLISSFFGGGGSSRSGRVQRRGSDLRAEVAVTLADVLAGCERELSSRKLDYCSQCDGTGSTSEAGAVTCGACRGMGQVGRQQTTLFGSFSSFATCPACGGAGVEVQDPCPSCHGEGRTMQEGALTISIPPGVDQGTRIRVAGQGEAGQRGAPPGDLYVDIAVEDHDLFHREGSELAVEVSISFPQAALGTRIEAPCLDGVAMLDIPPGTQSGTRLKVKGRGLPSVRHSRRGDLHVFVNVRTPTDLSDSQRQLLGKLAEQEEGVIVGSSRERDKSLLSRWWNTLMGDSGQGR